MRNQQSGFTLIELIAVVVILGILAATAVPKFVNLSDAAQDASVNNIAGSLESASALNHAVDIANDAGLTSDTPQTISACDDDNAKLLLEGETMPSGYTVSGDASDADADGVLSCIVTHTKTSKAASFNLLVTS